MLVGCLSAVPAMQKAIDHDSSGKFAINAQHKHVYAGTNVARIEPELQRSRIEKDNTTCTFGGLRKQTATLTIVHTLERGTGFRHKGRQDLQQLEKMLFGTSTRLVGLL